ncbi:putative oligosaccharyltransferase alpha subunit [Mrakia frigida]|uniref:dolichyl-diphosphooligosaccharide--protein glycotransferase subunit OST1 n=1 Tax=Mrakia frigida TaxID=29902 RepID=UPI003FCBFDC3
MLLPRLVALALLPLLASAAASFQNTAIVRTIELGGSISVVSTTYTAKVTSQESATEYIVGLGKEEESKVGWFDVREKKARGGEGGQLEWRRGRWDERSSSRLYHIILSSPLSTSESITFTTTLHLVAPSYAKPASIAQSEDQYLMFVGDIGVHSPYPTDVERVKFRAPTTTILSHSEVPTEYTRDSTITKSGATLTLGPYYNVPAKTEIGQGFEIHYKYDAPVISLRSLKRAVEVSHWGNNLNVQDDIVLFNSGPTLKGHFSRITHQQAKHYRRPAPQILSDISLNLPPHATDPYYYDIIGNVSTSNFRPSPPPTVASSSTVKRRVPAAAEQGSVLELRPRYPIAGGWNFTFTVGWDAPLGDSLKRLSGGEYLLGVPFLTGMTDVAVDEVEFTVILPEGAKDVSVETPFPLENAPTHFIHTTYLDSLGRPAIKIVKSLCTEKCGEDLVYVKYTLSPLAHWQKTFAVTTVSMGLFGGVMMLKRALGAK